MTLRGKSDAELVHFADLEAGALVMDASECAEDVGVTEGAIAEFLARIDFGDDDQAPDLGNPDVRKAILYGIAVGVAAVDAARGRCWAARQ